MKSTSEREAALERKNDPHRPIKIVLELENGEVISKLFSICPAVGRCAGDATAA